jgi:hypothetical protein
MTRSTLRGGLVPALVLGLLAGCGDGSATVSGTVTYDGQPVKEGYVTFSPADGKGPSAGGPIANGRYTAEKVPPGPKIVLVEAADKPVPSVQSQGDVEKLTKELKGKLGPDGIIRADTIPPTADGNSRKVDVKAGSQELNLDIKKPAAR